MSALRNSNPEVTTAIAVNLRYWRKQAGLSQAELAALSGAHRTEISLLERKMRIPRADTLVRLAQSLNVTTDQLLEGITWHPSVQTGGGFSIQLAHEPKQPVTEDPDPD
jgi:transcriptional regulator with XRE-family HTH domain